ncbi:hypothetical protein BsWGS_08901 [Bradybaena similaris]
MHIRYDNVTGCCPGWEKRSPRDVDCTKPVCDEGCDNEGQCVGPGLCICSEGYTGYKCHIDIDECTGRNTCQQKCANLPGSYECSCQEGFVLADDEYTCDLCLSCTEDFKNLYTQIEYLQNQSSGIDNFDLILQQMNNLTQTVTQNDALRAIQNQIYNINDSIIHIDRFQVLENEVDAIKGMIKEVDTIKDLNSRLYNLEESSQNNGKFDDIQNQINELNKVKDLTTSVQWLNDTLVSLQQDSSQAARLEEMQKQIEELEIIKAQQDQTQQTRLEELAKELEQLRGINGLSETVQGINDLLGQVEGRIDDLESDKLDALAEIAKQAEKFQDLQKQVDSLKDTVKQVDIIKNLTIKVETLEESSHHTEAFQKLQSQIDDLAVTKTLTTTLETLNSTVRGLLENDDQASQLEELQRQIDDIVVNAAQQEKTQSDRFKEMQSDVQQLKQLNVLSQTVNDVKDALAQMSGRIQQLESDKATLESRLAKTVAEHEAAISEFKAKDVPREHTTTDAYDADHEIPLDRLVSLSEQISILEERMADCSCGQDYPQG